MKLPLPSVNFPELVRQAQNLGDIPSQTFGCVISGEITTDVTGQPICTVLEDGVLTDFVVSVSQQGRDDTDSLVLSADLLKNGTTVLSAPVELEGASGEAGVAAVGDVPTFVTTAVTRGDRLSMNVTLTRTTPDTEIGYLYAGIKIVPVRE